MQQFKPYKFTFSTEHAYMHSEVTDFRFSWISCSFTMYTVFRKQFLSYLQKWCVDLNKNCT